LRVVSGALAHDYLLSQAENWTSFIGLFFVLIVLFFPRGVLGIIRRKAIS
jgi:branched-chain amino acid transport system permease protein